MHKLFSHFSLFATVTLALVFIIRLQHNTVYCGVSRQMTIINKTIHRNKCIPIVIWPMGFGCGFSTSRVMDHGHGDEHSRFPPVKYIRSYVHPNYKHYCLLIFLFIYVYIFFSLVWINEPDWANTISLSISVPPCGWNHCWVCSHFTSHCFQTLHNNTTH